MIKNNIQENNINKKKRILVDELYLDSENENVKFEYYSGLKDKFSKKYFFKGFEENESHYNKNKIKPNKILKGENSILNAFNLTYDDKNNKINKSNDDNKNILALKDGKIEKLLIQKAKKEIDRTINPLRLLEKKKNFKNNSNEEIKIEKKDFTKYGFKDDCNSLNSENKKEDEFITLSFEEEPKTEVQQEIYNKKINNINVKEPLFDVNRNNEIKFLKEIKFEKRDKISMSPHDENFKSNILKHNKSVNDFKKKYFHSSYILDNNLLNKKRKSIKENELYNDEEFKGN